MSANPRKAFSDIFGQLDFVKQGAGPGRSRPRLKASLSNVVWLSAVIKVEARVGIEHAMSTVSARLSLLTALADPSVKKINLTVDDFSIRPENYERVKNAIIRGSIIVRFNGSLKNPRTGLPYCRYTPYSDILELGFSTCDRCESNSFNDPRGYARGLRHGKVRFDDDNDFGNTRLCCPGHCHANEVSEYSASKQIPSF